MSVDGNIYSFDRDRTLCKVFHTKMDKPLSFTAGGELLFCGGHEGLIKVISIKTEKPLSIIIPKPPQWCEKFVPDVVEISY